ncbi:hypothetical protein F6R98_17980 [Candidatus Methylospira mobilis]|uniref:Uncharacterized protein n=1 Tax=Candidatus Methylospira mobilis TaxID=1808979 RepID=A0A5Q0BL20_9GAMM|nr:hypothetical protein [Candidatus Methylospira mobilis]QFY44289.1 hypothetical protein F6R98_17980 [Candidatus Methylospira mobilis]WNV06286.1 hypothetical protein RP726_07725 [Candidatus Methylospira mobilis]
MYLRDGLYEKLKTRSRNVGVSISGLIRRSQEKDIQQDAVALTPERFSNASIRWKALPASNRKISFENCVKTADYSDPTAMMPERLILDTDIVIHLLKNSRKPLPVVDKQP